MHNWENLLVIRLKVLANPRHYSLILPAFGPEELTKNTD